MKRILLITDNHGDKETIEKIFEKEQFDFSIHLGDALLDESYISDKFDWYVTGNNEDFSIKEDNFTIEEMNISILHGHTRGIGPFEIKDGALSIAKENNSSLVLFGHTHYPFDETIEGIRIINPGALSKPRYESKCSYGIIEIEKGTVINNSLITL